MPIIKTRVDGASYAKLLKLRRAAGLPSISALFLDRCDLLNDEKEAREIVRQALNRAKRRPPGEEFRLRDLFSEPLWQKFPKGARLRAGRMFHEKIGAAVDGIRIGRKSSSGHQFYKVAQLIA